MREFANSEMALAGHSPASRFDPFLRKSRSMDVAVPRLFTAFEIPPDIARHLALFRGGLPGARWIEPADYHITLRFLGDIDDRTAHDVAELLAGVRRSRFELAFAGLDAFGGNRPRALVASLAPNLLLAELQAEQERIARRAGLPPETRKFTPHVTLARLKGTRASDVAAYLSGLGGFRGAFTPDRFVLFSSRASVGGGPYVVEADYPLD
jgi:2'-5' RNA ligase